MHLLDIEFSFPPVLPSVVGHCIEPSLTPPEDLHLLLLGEGVSVESIPSLLQ